MSFPTIVAPEYTIQLKSIKEPVVFRPYTVKEEKLFLMAKESSDSADMNAAIVQVLRNCTFNKIAIEKLPSFDVEYLFLQLRAKSVNNVVELQYRCENPVEKDGQVRPCHTLNPVRIPLDEIAVTVPEGHSNIVKIDDQYTLELQYPTSMVLAQVLANTADAFTLSTQMVASCIKSVISADGTVHEAIDSTDAERIAFVESLTLAQMERLQVFFTTMPSLSYTTTFTCRSCGYMEPIQFEGLADFFD